MKFVLIILTSLLAIFLTWTSYIVFTTLQDQPKAEMPAAIAPQPEQIGPDSTNSKKHLLTAAPTQTPIATMNPSVLGKTTQKTIDKQALYGLINAHRREHKQPALRVAPSLEQSAHKKIVDMITNEYYQHTDRNGTESWYLFRQTGYHFTQAGENLSFGNNTPWDIFTAWQASTEHNAQLLKAEYLDMGLAVDCQSYTIGRTASCITVLHLGAK